MDNLEKYVKVFMECLSIEKDQLGEALEYQSVPTWDSVGHMGLVSELEETFDIALETNDIIEFNSYEKGKEILTKYGIEF